MTPLSLTITVGGAVPVNIGQTAVLPTADNGNANLLIAQPITLTAPSTLQSLSFYVTVAGGQLVLGLYSDAAGKPSALQAQTAAFTPTVGWSTVPTTSPTLPPGQYWLAYLPQSNTLSFVKATTIAGNIHCAQTFGALPGTFPTTGQAASGSQWSFYGTFLQQQPPPTQGLQAIDGETMNGTTMTHGYFNGRGLSLAAGYDSPNFFLLAPDAVGVLSSPGGESTTIATLQDLNLNAIARIQGSPNTDLSLLPALAAAGINGMPQPRGTSLDIPAGPQILGILQDEPSVWSDVTNSFGPLPNSTVDTRICAVNFNWITAQWTGTWDVFNSGMHAAFTTPLNTQGGKNHLIDLVSMDWYWFCGAQTGTPTTTLYGPGMYQNTPAGGGFIPGWNTGNMPLDLQARAARYGDMIDGMRSWANGTNTHGFTYGAAGNTSPQSPVPLGVYIEVGDGRGPGAPSWNPITPAQINAAVWMCIIHGARLIYYFTHDFNHQPNSDNLLNASWWNPSASYTQVKATNLLVKQLAPVINSPKALGYVTVSPPASVWAGFDLMAKWYQGGNITNQGLPLVNGFYVFAAYRGSQTDTNIPATFTVNSTATIANVVGENRSIAITGGTFSDVFATGLTVHIYQIS